MSQTERAIVQDAMDDAGDNQTKAAEVLGISQQAPGKKVLKWGVT